MENQQNEELQADLSMEDFWKTAVFAAETCHNVNRVYCQSLGDYSQPTWDDADDETKATAITVVVSIVTHGRDASPQKSHESWMNSKKLDGWVYGEVKDAKKKTHPCMVPYSELPPEQKFKDELFYTIVRTFFPLSKEVEESRIITL